mmetsp:Transcript_140729/g.392256  ORF Transcript_140729/g.392256 Transcript_140729/m.392256 type:complete len:429 (-) Transcript_140729:103-1389(-)
MITYKKGYAGIFLLLRFAGTSWPHGILPGLLSACFGLVLSFAQDMNAFISDGDEFWLNPYPYQLFAYLVGFVLVFRTNFGYSRYWEALDAVQRMGAKWLDGACMAIAFDAKGDVTSPFLQCSILVESSEPGSGSWDDAKSKNAGLDHTEFFDEVVHLFSLMHALAFQHLRCDGNLANLRRGSMPKLVVLGEEPARDTSANNLLSCYPASSIAKRWPLRLTVLGGLSGAEHMTLESDSRGKQLPTLARVAMVESWIMRRLVARQKHEPAGDMCKTSPPILSRMVQVISDGNLAFSQAAKVAETPFPFPYHNLISLFLWMFALTTPFVVNANLLNIFARFVINFVAVWAYFSLSEVGNNLEDPFMPYDPNDLPLEVLHQSFNARLLAFGVVPGAAPLPFCPASPPSPAAPASPKSGTDTTYTTAGKITSF